MSDESENAATNSVIAAYRNASDAKAKLESKMKELGSVLGAFSGALQTPERYVFDVTKTAVTVGQPDAELRRPIAHVTPSEFDWEFLQQLLDGYIEAVADKKDSVAKLRAMGLPVPE